LQSFHAVYVSFGVCLFNPGQEAEAAFIRQARRNNAPSWVILPTACGGAGGSPLGPKPRHFRAKIAAPWRASQRCGFYPE